MSKAAEERKTIDAILHNSSYFSGYRVCESERPDFVLTKGDDSIGLEHCLIDMLLDDKPLLDKRKTPASVSRQNEAILRKIFDEFSGNKIFGNEDNALHAIERVINSNLAAEHEFSSIVFEYAWRHGISSHLRNVDSYFANENLFVNKCIGLVCEVPLPPSKYDWCVKKTNDALWSNQRICGLPLTQFMRLVLVMALTSTPISYLHFDFVVVVTRGLDFADVRVKMYDLKTAIASPIYVDFKPAYSDIRMQCSLSLAQ